MGSRVGTITLLAAIVLAELGEGRSARRRTLIAAVVAATALALAWEWGRLTRLRWNDRVGTAAAAVTALAAWIS